MNASVVYLSYDGLLDPLGSSQILPYIEGISRHPRSLYVISFEKNSRFLAGYSSLAAKLERYGVTWIPLTFTSSLGSAGKIWDLLKMYVAAVGCTLKERPSYVHARGHAAAQIGAFLKRWIGVKLIFDFRGLWADERVDKGSWKLNRISHRLQYRYYKRIERYLLGISDEIIVLTEAVVDEVVRLSGVSEKKITVIPCCADFDHFLLADASSRKSARSENNIPQEATVLCYLGSVGGMYWTEKFFRFCELVISKRSNIYIFALSTDLSSFKTEMVRYLPSVMWPLVVVRAASRDEVSRWLPAVDILVSFCRPSYARISMSPTKLAEAFAVGIPAICNYGVGDVAGIISDLDAGLMVDPSLDTELERVANDILSVLPKGGVRLRSVARKKLGLEVANKRYESIYRKLDISLKQ